MKNAQNWYVRRDNKLKGPFPAGLISQYLMLGRFRETDEVSADREQWLRIFEVPGLVPDVMAELKAHPNDPEVQARFEAAKRWADERRAPHAALPVDQERRREESIETLSLRESRAARGGIRAPRRVVEFAALAAVILLVIGTPFLLPNQTATITPQCEAPPAPAVVWSNCLMPGRDLANADLTGADLRSADLSTAVLRGASLRDADLAYAKLIMASLRGANLSGAKLTGASLRGADLSNANLSGTDLSYAILSGSNLERADLTGARLDHAQWGDGVECLPGSVGTCQQGRLAR